MKSSNKGLERSLVPLSTIFVVILATFLSMGSMLWFLPIIGAVVSLYGLMIRNKKPVDYGHLFIILTFFLINRNTPFSLPNILLMIGFFFLSFASWDLFRKEIFVASMDRGLDDAAEEERKIFEKDTLLALMNFIFMGFLLTFTGALISIYGLVGIDLPNDYLEPMFIVFGSVTLAAAYIIVRMIPLKIHNDLKDDYRG
ncbi:MAG: hypothetical protein ACQESD_04205 [Thermoplasmatota archaeon]